MQIGDPIEFQAEDQNNAHVSLAQFRGSVVVLFFYPRADTPGCTTEACEFRDVEIQLKKAGAVVLGISRDAVRAQKKFADKFSLPFPLLADPDLVIAKQFDVVREGSMYGKPVTKVERSTFVIDGEGRLRAEFRKVSPEGHAAEMLQVVQQLTGKA